MRVSWVQMGLEEGKEDSNKSCQAVPPGLSSSSAVLVTT